MHNNGCKAIKQTLNYHKLTKNTQNFRFPISNWKVTVKPFFSEISNSMSSICEVLNTQTPSRRLSAAKDQEVNQVTPQ